MRKLCKTKPVNYSDSLGCRHATGGQSSSRTNSQVTTSLSIVNDNGNSFLRSMLVDLHLHGDSALQRLSRASSIAADMLEKNPVRHTIASMNACKQKAIASPSPKKRGGTTQPSKAKKTKKDDKYKKNAFVPAFPDKNSIIGIETEKSAAPVMNSDSGNDIVMNLESGNDVVGINCTGINIDGVMVLESGKSLQKEDVTVPSPEDLLPPPPTAVVDPNHPLNGKTWYQTELKDGGPGHLRAQLTNQWSKQGGDGQEALDTIIQAIVWLLKLCIPHMLVFRNPTRPALWWMMSVFWTPTRPWLFRILTRPRLFRILKRPRIFWSPIVEF